MLWRRSQAAPGNLSGRDGSTTTIQQDPRFVSRSGLASLENWAYTQLKEAIIRLTLPPGSVIVEAQLAEQLGVSKTPLRSALLQLEREGFIDSIPYKGSRVVPITLAAIRQLFQVREAVERYAICEAVRTMTAEEFVDVERLLCSEQEATAAQDWEEAHALEERFHQIFIERLGNPHLSRIAQNISDHRRRLRLALADFRPDPMRGAIERHRALLRAMQDQDRAAAERYVAEGIENSLTWLEAAEKAGILPPGGPVPDSANGSLG
jgi:DNA-binding GntR family transcriptional regulator